MAEKDGSVRLARTRCDFCSEPASAVIGNYVVCGRHVAHAMNADAEKQASDREKSLKAAGIDLVDKHK